MGRAAVRSRTKTPQSAVVAIPPADSWEPIQAIRRRHDTHFHRWMPHVTLLYPFRPEADFEAAIEALKHACQSAPPFTVTLARFSHFVHGRGRFTIWLEPEPRDVFVGLQSALQQEFADCDDVSAYAGGFTPHLSVGQASGARTLEPLLAELRASWSPLAFLLRGISLIHRRGDDPFRVFADVPFGRPSGGGPPPGSTRGSG